MTTMIKEVYDALLEAGASDEKATAAAQSIANYENRFHTIEKELVDVRGVLKRHSWMIGINTAGILFIIKLVLDVLQRLPLPS